MLKAAEIRSISRRQVAAAICEAGEPQCENADGWWVYSASSGKAVPRTCKKWECSGCRKFKRLAVLVALQHGVAYFHAAGHEIHALTLTDRTGLLDFASFYAAWDNRLRPWLRRHGYVHAYASAMEVQPMSQRLHCHVLLVAPLGSSGFVPIDELSRACERAGLGYAWIDHVNNERVRNIPAVSSELAGYFTKGAGGDYSVQTPQAGAIGSYMAKAKEMQALGGLAGSRLRPFRVSRNWPLNLTESIKRLRLEMFGEGEPEGWVVVHEGLVAEWLTPLREERRATEERERRWAQSVRLHEARERLGGAGQSGHVRPYSGHFSPASSPLRV